MLTEGHQSYCCCLVAKLCLTKSYLTFAIPSTVAHQAPLSMSRQEYWIGLPFYSPRDLLDPGIKPASPACQVDSLPLSHQEAHQLSYTVNIYICLIHNHIQSKHSM